MDLFGLLSMVVRELTERLGGTLREPGTPAGDPRALAMADILALAALADGQVTREELRALEETVIGEGELAVAAVERLYQLEASAEDIQSPEWLEVKVADLALALDAAERRRAMQLVIALARHGARLKPRELSNGSVVGLSEHELTELFARGLGIEAAELARLEGPTPGA